jgi:hypothetical protein
MTQRLVLGTLVGGVVLTLLGYLVYGVVFADFFAANAGSATGVPREPFNFVALVAGQLAWGAVLTLILTWGSVASVGQAVKVAAVTGLLFMLGIDLTMYGTTNVQNLTALSSSPSPEAPSPLSQPGRLSRRFMSRGRRSRWSARTCSAHASSEA